MQLSMPVRTNKIIKIKAVDLKNSRILEQPERPFSRFKGLNMGQNKDLMQNEVFYLNI